METINTKFVSVEQDSHFYTYLEQIKITLEHLAFLQLTSPEYVLTGIKNTINHGYRIIPPATPLVKGDYAIYMKGKKPILVKVRVITKTGIYHIKRQDTGMTERITNSSKLIKYDYNLEVKPKL